MENNLKPTKDEAIIALEVLKEYAREFCTNPEYRDQVDAAHLIGAAISNLIDHDLDLSAELAANLLEDINYHDMASIVRGEDKRARWV